MATTVLGSQNRLHYKGYTGSVFFSVEDDCLHGKILDIDDLITYEGETVKDIKAAFEAAVERYVSCYIESQDDVYAYIDGCVIKRINSDGSIDSIPIEDFFEEKG